MTTPASACTKLRQARAPLEPEADPQRQHRQAHGHADGGDEPPGIEHQPRRRPHRQHAAVVHGADARAHQRAAQRQLAVGDARARQQVQRHRRGRQAGQRGEQRHAGVVVHIGAELERHHADEVHGPHAAGQGHRPGAQRHLPVQAGRRAARLAGQLQRHTRGGDRHDQRQGHQPGVIGTRHELGRRNVLQQEPAAQATSQRLFVHRGRVTSGCFEADFAVDMVAHRANLGCGALHRMCICEARRVLDA
jgi:hypothetical protein